MVSVVFVGSFLAAQDVFAADFEASLDTTVKIEKLDKRAKITTKLTIKNKVKTETPKSLAIPVYGTDIKSLVATYSSSGAKVVAKYDAKTRAILLDVTRSFAGKNEEWGINVSYSSQIVELLGNSSFITLQPTLDEGGEIIAFSGETRQLELDLGIGVATRIGATKPTSSLSIGKQILTWADSSHIDYATGVVFGDSSLANVSLSTTLKNTGFWWTTKHITLPPDTNQQRVFIESIEPKPSNIRVDFDGNVIAEYNLRPKQSIDVTAKAKVLINNYTYALSSADETIDEEQKTLLTDYLSPHADWPVIAVTVPEDATIIGGISEIMKAVRELPATSLGSDSFSQNANRSDSFVGTLRANNVPARSVRGIVTNSDGQVPHVWAEVFVGGLGWITVDPSGDTNSLATADSRYIALLVRSQDNFNPTSYVSDTKVEYVEGSELPETTGAPTLSSTTYMFLPGLGLRVASVTLPEGQVSDGAVLVFENDRLTNLGSVAPLQKITSRDPLLGSKAMNPTKVSYTTENTDDDSEELSIISKVSWLPMIVEGVVIVLGALGVIIWKKRDGFNFSMPKLGRKKKVNKNTHKAIDERTSFHEDLNEVVVEEPEKQKPKKGLFSRRKPPIEVTPSQTSLETSTTPEISRFSAETNQQTKPRRKPRRKLVQ